MVPEFLEKQPATVVSFLKGWLRGSQVFRDAPRRAAEISWDFYAKQGYSMDRSVFDKTVASTEIRPEFRADLKPYLSQKAGELLKERCIKRIPDRDKVLRGEYLQQAEAALGQRPTGGP